jgi:RNA polymerase sigma factor (sigma-70 family)
MVTFNELILGNLSLAEKLARIKSKRTPKCVQLDELLSAAYLGLTLAAHGFDDSRGVPFAAYAECRIKGSMCDYLRELKWVSRSDDRTVSSYERDDDNSLKDAIEDQPDSNEFDLMTESLKDSRRNILELYYVWGFTQKEIGSKIGVNESRVSQILAESRQELAKALA